MLPDLDYWLQKPRYRRLRVYAFDPSLSLNYETASMNSLIINIPWEDLEPGPVGEYLEVIDIDPASGLCYPPVDLDHPYLMSQDGLPPLDGTPQFHQQMVYAVARKTIQNFEEALGRKVLVWPRSSSEELKEYTSRLRLYPHALRDANAYYSPAKQAILFGYFPASHRDPRGVGAGRIVFTCLSHDIIAHEVTHALLDGMHPYFAEPSNIDVLALHEAFADIVALFQHFSFPEVLRHQIAHTRGDLSGESLLSELARQFGEAMGKRGALRDAIGLAPDPQAIQETVEPHQRGSILVAAVFEAFIKVYQHRVADLMGLATGGTRVLPEGQIHPDLVSRLSEEAASIAQHILTMCVRALDYCPPVDITFGDYLRAIITADYELFPEDRYGYRLALMDSFQRRGIMPEYVKSVSDQYMKWLPALHDEILDDFFTSERLKVIRDYETELKLRASSRSAITQMDDAFGKIFYNWLVDELAPLYEKKGEIYIDEVVRSALLLELWPLPDLQSIYTDQNGRPALEVNSVRLAHRTSPNGVELNDLIVEINQRRMGYLDPQMQSMVDLGKISPPPPDFILRGGVTILIDQDTGKIRYVIGKRVSSNRRLIEQRRFLVTPDRTFGHTYKGDTRVSSIKGTQVIVEPFALLHGATDMDSEY